MRVKKIVSFTMILVFILTLFAGCRNTDEKPKGHQYFNAIVLELNEDSIKVRCTEEFNSGIAVGEEISVPTDVIAAKGIPDMNVSDDIHIVFNGDTLDMDSKQIGIVFAIYLLDENGEVLIESIAEK